MPGLWGICDGKAPAGFWFGGRRESVAPSDRRRRRGNSRPQSGRDRSTCRVPLRLPRKAGGQSGERRQSRPATQPFDSSASAVRGRLTFVGLRLRSGRHLFQNEDLQFSTGILSCTAGKRPVSGLPLGIADSYITGSSRDKFVEADNGLFLLMVVYLHRAVTRGFF